MSGGDLALGIDIGTSGLRCAALDGKGRIVVESAARFPGADDARRDPAIWRGALETALEDLLAAIEPSAIGAVAVDGTSGTLLALDRAGAPIGPGSMYDDRARDQAALDAIAAAAPAQSAAHGATSALARACALARRPGVVRLVHQADWLVELLAGEPLGSDESNALKTGYDPIARRWPDWLDAVPIDRALLPGVTAVGSAMGACVGAHGLAPGTPIVAGATDGCASFLATGAAAPGSGVTALGSTLTLKLLSDQPIFAPAHGVYSHRIGAMWLAGGASNTGGKALAPFFAPERIGALSAAIDPSAPSGLDYYPLPRPGERFPINDPDLAPRVAPRPRDDAAFLHGLLEGIGRIEARGYALLRALGGPALRDVRTVGGGADNATWTTLRARLLEVPLREAASTEAAAGAARIARAHLAGVTLAAAD